MSTLPPLLRRSTLRRRAPAAGPAAAQPSHRQDACPHRARVRGLGADGRQDTALHWPGTRQAAPELKGRCLQLAASGLSEGGRGRGILTPEVRVDRRKRASQPEKRSGNDDARALWAHANAWFADGGKITCYSRCPVVLHGAGVSGQLAGNSRWRSFQSTGIGPHTEAALSHCGNGNAVLGLKLLVSSLFLHVHTLQEMMLHFIFRAALLNLASFIIQIMQDISIHCHGLY